MVNSLMNGRGYLESHSGGIKTTSTILILFGTGMAHGTGTT